MKTRAMDSLTCPTCGRLLPSGVLQGLCPACLLAQGAESVGYPGFAPPPAEEVARLFPQLEILGLLGSGGMGAVYRARQPALDRIVALKVLPAGDGGRADFAERFNREARALARLSHPNVVAVYEFGRAGDLHYFLMEFVDGSNLRQLERTGRLSTREALQIIPQICDALQYAHNQGVVHRDIKPENVLVDRTGRVKIADFGLARILGLDPAASRLTLEGQVMGTPHYMAPEQLERPLTVDHRADIYSFGVVIYEMLTGDLPLGKFSPPSRKVQVDVRLDEVVLRALENDPACRYQRASELKTRVESISSGPEATSASAKEPAHRSVRWAGINLAMEIEGRRRWHWPGVLALGGLTSAILAVALGLVMAVNPGLFRKDDVPIRRSQVAVMDPESGQLIARLPGGGSIELLALGDGESRTNCWWRADGRLIQPGRIEITQMSGLPPRDDYPRSLLFRTLGLPPESGAPRLEADPAANCTAGGQVRRDGRLLPNALPVIVGWQSTIRTPSLRIGYGLEPWRTAVVHRPAEGSVSHHERPGDPAWSVSLNHLREDANNLAAAVIVRPQNLEWETRLVVVDTNGFVHPFSHANGNPDRHGATWTYLFGGLKRDQVQEIRFQVRRLDWIEFPNLPLEPSTNASYAIAFGVVQERAFDEVIDFDSGKTADFPPGPTGANPWAGSAENLLWMQEQGFDAAAGNGLIQVDGMDVLPLEPSAWELFTADETLRQLSTGAVIHPRRLPPRRAMLQPATYAFRTREGGMGLLQFVRFESQRPGVTVRFKMLSHPTGVR